MVHRPRAVGVEAREARYHIELFHLPPMPSSQLSIVPRTPFTPFAVIAGGAALLLLLGVGAEQVRLAGARAELIALAESLDVGGPELVREIRHARDAARARLAVADALLTAELGGPADRAEPELSGRRLETARELASGTLRDRPTSWQAATITGAATYLAWSGHGSRTRDPRLLQEYRRWEEPLLLARRLAPGRDEPVRALVSAYVELWPALSADKRRLARELAGRALQDRRTFDRLIEPWLAAAGTGPEALDVIPDQAWAWNRITAIMATRADWTGFCDAWQRRGDALDRSLRTALDDARAHLDRGEVVAARAALLGMVTTAPPEPRFAPLVDAALRAAPPGPPRPELIPALRSWLRWQLVPTRSGDGLSLDALARLRSAAFPGSLGSEDLPLAARATLALGGPNAIQRAERIERKADDLWSDAWGLYFVEKAAVLARSGRTDGARDTLDRVHPTWRKHALFLTLAAELARSDRSAGQSAGRSVEQARIRADLEHSRAREWSATDWSWGSATPTLEMLVAEAGDGLRIVIAEAPEAGAAIEARLDGHGAGCREIRPGDTLTLATPISAGAHALELATLAGKRVWPGPVELLTDTADR